MRIEDGERVVQQADGHRCIAQRGGLHGLFGQRLGMVALPAGLVLAGGEQRRQRGPGLVDEAGGHGCIAGQAGDAGGLDGIQPEVFAELRA